MSLSPNLNGFTKEEIIETLNEIRHPVEVAVIGTKNVFNFGGIIRTCHNFLVKKIYAIEIEKFYKKGALSTLKWEKSNIEYISLEESKSEFWDRNLISFERRHDLESEDIRTFTYPENPILLFGSENYGIPDELLKLSRSVVSIPGFGLVNSLNVAVATSIVLYDWVKKYYEGNKNVNI